MPVNPILAVVTSLAKAAVRTFLVTWLVMIVIGIALAITADYLMPEVTSVVRVLIELLIVFEFVVLGAIIASRRSLLGTLMHGLKRQQLARSSVRMLFDRFAAVSAEESPGERGNVAIRAAERLPLAKAEELLQRILRGFAGALASRTDLPGRMGQRLQSHLFGRVGSVTLSKFRDHNKQHGGVDVLRVRDELENHIDTLLIGRLRWTVNLWTFGVLAVVVAQVFALVYVAKFFSQG